MTIRGTGGEVSGHRRTKHPGREGPTPHQRAHAGNQVDDLGLDAGVAGGGGADADADGLAKGRVVGGGREADAGEEAVLGEDGDGVDEEDGDWAVSGTLAGARRGRRGVFLFLFLFRLERTHRRGSRRGDTWRKGNALEGAARGRMRAKRATRACQKRGETRMLSLSTDRQCAPSAGEARRGLDGFGRRRRRRRGSAGVSMPEGEKRKVCCLGRAQKRTQRRPRPAGK